MFYVSFFSYLGFLERVVVTDLKDPRVKYFCPCSKWLARDEDDGQIAREIPAYDSPYNNKRINII